MTTGNYLKHSSLLTPEECLNASNRVKQLKAQWIPRGGGTFYTIGASTYNDSPEDYARLAYGTNMLIAREFGDLLYKVCDFFEHVLASKVIFLPYTGLMGFHIFDHTADGLTGHIHIDHPFKRIQWPSPVSHPLTITLPLELPDEGGLNVYPDIDEVWFAQYDAGINITPPDALYHPYEAGKIYWHSGLLAHQIANPCPIREGQHRITLQGHAVRLQNGATVLYF